MFEVGLVVMTCLAMGKVADADGRSALVWALITLGFCLASIVIPLPFLRILIAGMLSFIALMVVKARAGR
jgi:hypothetical protein